MARPTKQGLDYFPLDSQFLSDVKVRKIMRAQGTNAISVLISLLCNIYRDKGYYIKRDDEVSFLIADEVGVKEEYVNEIIDKSIQVGFFDEYQYKKNKILTSNGIQKRFLEATERRKDVVFNELFRVNVNNNSINVNNNEINDSKSTQSKVKESKEKKIDFSSLLSFINQKTGRNFKNINDSVKKKFNARLKDGYSKTDILNAIKNATNNEYHKSNNYQYLTPEFFSRADTLDKYSDVKKESVKITEQEIIPGPWAS